jgi:hypothetical protein
MINKSIDKNRLFEILKEKKGTLVAVSGILATVTLMTGCGKANQANKVEPFHETVTATYQGEEVKAVQVIAEDIKQDGISSFLPSDVDAVDIHYTNLTDASELSKYRDLKFIDISDNLVYSVDDLGTLSNLEALNISNNSVQNVNLQDFESLKELGVKGNYNLYTKETLEYCKRNNINIDINEQDVELVDQLRVMLSNLNLEGKTDLEKEKAICDFICKHIEYDKKALKDDALCEDYNRNPLKYAIDGTGVCANYAAMFKAMCQLSGINNFTIEGNGKNEAHAWNLVEIDGQYMLCDVTWIDNQIGPLETAYMKFNYYNKSGKGAESFAKDHEPTRKIYAQDLAKESNIKNISSYESTGEKLGKAIDNANEYINITADNLGMSYNQLMMIVLTGLGLGAATMLTKEEVEKLKPKIEKKKKEKEEKKKELAEQKRQEEIEKRRAIAEQKIERIRAKEELKRRKKKLKEIKHTTSTVTMSDDTPKTTKKIEVKPSGTDKLPVEPKTTKKVTPTLDEILSSLPSDEARIEYLDQKAKEKLTEIATLQVSQEIERHDVKEEDKLEAIENAKEELKSMFITETLSKEQRALKRCKRQGYIDEDRTLEQLQSNDDKLTILSTINLYRDVDRMMLEEYSKLYTKSASLKVATGQPLDPELMKRSNVVL